MGGKPEPVETYPADKRFCCTLCICQMVAVLSAVSMVYLAVAIYAPSMRALDSKISEEPVMCYTIANTVLNQCNVTPTCGEWCLSKSQGNCTVVNVLVRRNGSNLRMEECNETYEKECEILKLKDEDMVNCVKDGCKELTGQYNCTKGKCHDYTTRLQCNHQNSPEWETKNCHKTPRDCRAIEGLQQCSHGVCKKIEEPYTCERRCIDIQTGGKNVIILQGDYFLMANCKRVVSNDTGRVIWEHTNEKNLMMSCYDTELLNNRTEIWGLDCINGTVVTPDVFGGNQTNLTRLMQAYFASHVRLEYDKEILYVEEGKQVTKEAPADGEVEEEEVVDEEDPLHSSIYPIPIESELIIYNNTQLRINIEGCVNSLRNECEGVLENYGRDGTQHAAAARFPCHYSEDDSSYVVLRFSRQAVVMELMIGSILPISLFVVSCFTLVVCSKTVIITDEGHFKCKYCAGDEMEGAAATNGERAMAL